MNVSINIFFRSVPPQHYAAGRDVYGNRDFAAYEDGRRDVERIVQRFLRVPKASNVQDQSEDLENGVTSMTMDAAIPKVIAKAYLERLACELMQRAEEL